MELFEFENQYFERFLIGNFVCVYMCMYKAWKLSKKTFRIFILIHNVSKWGVGTTPLLLEKNCRLDDLKNKNSFPLKEIVD